MASSTRAWLRRIVYVLFAIPLLFLAQCLYMDISQSSGLEALCETARVGSTVPGFLDAAAKTGFWVRTGAAAGKDEDDWFDREYLRIGSSLGQQDIADDYTVVFAKPGMGYYACIVVHRGGLVSTAWFEDHSS